MARRGRFGRLPRRAPDLSSTLVAIAREMQNLRDQNIKTAWEKGGEFEGKEVTDEMILQHWKDRRAAVDPNDPLWDYYNNLVENYEFSIEESKMTLKYAQHKVGEGAMSAFYRRWANKLPKDSEAYRTLMRSAAQYADAAASRARGSSAAAKQKAYQREWTNNYNKHVKGYRDSTGILVEAAVQAGILSRAEADRVHLRNSGSSDGAELTEMLIANAPQWDQNDLLLLFDHINTDPEYAVYRDALKKAGIENLTYDSYIGLAEDRKNGMKNGVAIANKYGDKDTAEKTKGALTDWNREIRLLKDLDEVAAYNELRHEYEEAVANTTDPFELDKLAQDYAKDLREIGMKATDPATRGAIFKEADANEGKLNDLGPGDWGTVGTTTIKESPTGRNPENTTGSNKTDLQETAENRKYLDAVIEGLSKGDLVRVPAEIAKSLGMDVSSGTPFYYAPTQAVAGLEQNQKGAIVFDTKNGRTIPEFVPFVEVHGRSPQTVDPNTMRPTVEAKPVAGQDTLIGYQMRLPNGEIRYGTLTEGGKIVWSADKPYNTGTVESSGPNNTIVVSPNAGTGKAVYTPRDMLNPRYATEDPSLMNSDKFPDVYTAANLGSKSGQRDLVNANEDDVRAFYTGKYGNSMQDVPDPADPNKTIKVKTVDLAMEDFHDARVRAAAYLTDPKLMQKEAAATAGVSFWDDYEERYERRQRSELDSLLKETPAAQEALRLQREAAEQQKRLGALPGYAGATKDAFGKAEEIAPWEVRQRAIDLIDQSSKFKAATTVFAGTGLRPSAESIVDNTPALKLPDVIKQFTGQAPPWVVNPYQPAGPNNPLHQTPKPGAGPSATPTVPYGTTGAGRGGVPMAPPKAPQPQPPKVEPPKPPPVPPIKPPTINPYTGFRTNLTTTTTRRTGGPTPL